MVRVTGVTCPATDLCYALGFDAAGSSWALFSPGPSASWAAPPAPLATVASGDQVTAFLPCVGSSCSLPASGVANTALGIIDGRPGTSLSGAVAVYACRGATSQCWAAAPSGSGFSASIVGSPVPVEAGVVP